ncbi:MAG: glycosyltransferase family 1 protein [bacterium]|nr:glycosyltransferase family 1 protein [bacterium]
MRIGIDARFFGPKTGGGGIGRYVEELLRQIDHEHTNHEFVVFLRKENFHAFRPKSKHFKLVLADIPWYSIKEQLLMPRIFHREKLDLVHIPHWNVPLTLRIPFIVTIHDLILLHQTKSAHATTRGPLTYGIKYAGFRIVLDHAIKNSQHIIVPSHATKNDILDHFSVKEENLTVIYHGLTPLPKSAVNPRELGIVPPYFLYVGNSYPHKNLRMLIHTFAQFHQTQPTVQLVLAGKRDRFSNDIESEAKEFGLSPSALRFIDHPSDEELSSLYEHAALFIYPSLIEGFGIPPLEALSKGTPVAAARTSSIPEILAEHALYFEPNDTTKLLDIMHAALTHPTDLHLLANAGKTFIQRYSWKMAARQTLSVYNR